MSIDILSIQNTSQMNQRIEDSFPFWAQYTADERLYSDDIGIHICEKNELE